jgi:hypothetical protein
VQQSATASGCQQPLLHWTGQAALEHAGPPGTPQSWCRKAAHDGSRTGATKQQSNKAAMLQAGPHLKPSSKLSLSPAARRPLSTTMSSTVPHSGQAPTSSSRLAACTSPPAAEVWGPPCLHNSSSSSSGASEMRVAAGLVQSRRLCVLPQGLVNSPQGPAVHSPAAVLGCW